MPAPGPRDERMTAEELAEARALEQAATPGEWRQGVHENDRVFCARGATLGLERVLARVNARCENWEADARFIAASRTLVPRLLAEVDRLRAEVAALRGALSEACELAKRGIRRGVLSEDGVVTDEHPTLRRIAELRKLTEGP